MARMLHLTLKVTIATVSTKRFICSKVAVKFLVKSLFFSKTDDYLKLNRFRYLSMNLPKLKSSFKTIPDELIATPPRKLFPLILFQKGFYWDKRIIYYLCIYYHFYSVQRNWFFEAIFTILNCKSTIYTIKISINI